MGERGKLIERIQVLGKSFGESYIRKSQDPDGNEDQLFVSHFSLFAFSQSRSFASNTFSKAGSIKNSPVICLFL